MSDDIGGYDTGMSWDRKFGGEDLCDLLGMGAERKGRPQQFSYY